MNARLTTLPTMTQTLATQSDNIRSAIPDLKDRVCAERLTNQRPETPTTPQASPTLPVDGEGESGGAVHQSIVTE
ncbi:hypothetical protein [Rhodococcus koreensis]|uniref:hypothetical protein n=1 Tax=Rhodococcus koreensis TaxID=99653 RepID=UPI00197DFC72|nr:hypothetical protein [Rhodococcus koreensis]QSE85545.1 hypothetical protein JWS14_29065 [Rhodococcus koreensis]